MALFTNFQAPLNRISIAISSTLISFRSAGTAAMLRRAVNDIKTNIAATLVCNVYSQEKRILMTATQEANSMNEILKKLKIKKKKKKMRRRRSNYI